MFFERRHRVFLAHLWNQDDGIGAVHFPLYGAERLPKQPLDTVAADALAVFFADGNAHRHFLGRTIDHGQRRGKGSFALLKESLKIRLFF